MGDALATPVVIYVVHHPSSAISKALAETLFAWFRHGDSDGVGVGVPLYVRRVVDTRQIVPVVPYDEAELNVVVALVGHEAVGDEAWREALLSLAGEAVRRRHLPTGRVLLLPVALDTSFYRVGKLYDAFNPVRLIDLDPARAGRVLRRAVTEAAARTLKAMERQDASPPPLDVFLSHAKVGGMVMAERLRDGVRKFGQLTSWYDANDLPYGSAWEHPMVKAATGDTAAMVAVVTDKYPSRPWCRREATLARTPRRVVPRGRVWTVQPVVAVYHLTEQWSREVPMLAGVPRMGWGWHEDDRDTQAVVDRLVLEALFIHMYRRLADGMDRRIGDRTFCYLTWQPDVWSLVALRKELRAAARRVNRIVYPGEALSAVEREELTAALVGFGKDARLLTYEEVA